MADSNGNIFGIRTFVYASIASMIDPLLWRFPSGIISGGGEDHVLSLLAIILLWGLAALYYWSKNQPPLKSIVLGFLDSYIVVIIPSMLQRVIVLHEGFPALASFDYYFILGGFLSIIIRLMILLKTHKARIHDLKYLGLYVIAFTPPILFWHFGLHDMLDYLGTIHYSDYNQIAPSLWEITVWWYNSIMYYWIVVKKLV